MGGPGLKMNFPIKNWDIPAIAMLVYQSVAIPGCLNHNKHHQNLPSSRDVRTARRRVVRQNQSICQVHGFQPTPRNVAPFKIWTNNKVLYIGYPGTKLKPFLSLRKAPRESVLHWLNSWLFHSQALLRDSPEARCGYPYSVLGKQGTPPKINMEPGNDGFQ